jgi:hypothetical protein
VAAVAWVGAAGVLGGGAAGARAKKRAQEPMCSAVGKFPGYVYFSISRSLASCVTSSLSTNGIKKAGKKKGEQK